MALLFCMGIAANAQQARGLWAGAFEADDVFGAVGVNFDDSKVILRLAGQEQTGALKDLKIDGNEISFSSETRPLVSFRGKFAGNKISGTFEAYRGDGTISSAGTWTARKVDSLEFKNEPKVVSGNENIELPKPAGKYFIGRKLFYWTDESRLETITDEPGDKRKVFVQLWYPADKPGKTVAEYYPDVADVFVDPKNREVEKKTKNHATTDAKLAKTKAKFPVLIFSPGLGSSPFTYTTIIENMVSRGYIVAAINHPYDSGDFKFSDGQIIRHNSEKWDRQLSKDYTEEQRRQFIDDRRFSWAKDFSFVLDRLAQLEEPFKGKLDLQNAGAFGHSFGGQATSIACASDPRFKACANLDGMAKGNVILPNESGKTLKQPFLFFTKAEEVSSGELKMMNISREEYRARERKRLLRWKPAFKNQMASTESASFLIIYPGINHASFGDWLILNPYENVTVERYAAVEVINSYIAAFFDKFLMKKSAILLEHSGESGDKSVLVEHWKK